MKRALFALVLIPVLASTMFGMLAFVVLPFMLAVTAFVALPLFLILRKAKCLSWWHALLAGAFCGVCFVLLNTILSSASDIDRLVSRNNIFYVGFGTAIGFIYWWAGIFRNSTFSFVSKKFPIGALAVLPLAFAVIFAYQALEEYHLKGRVITLLSEPGADPRQGQVIVRISDNLSVNADLSNTWPVSMVVGKCFHLSERWSTLRFRRVYQLQSPFGGGVDDC